MIRESENFVLSSHRLLAGLVVTISSILVAGCSQASVNVSPEQSQENGPSVVYQETEISMDQAVATQAPVSIDDAWNDSSHANTYVMDEQGQNSTCTACHSPVQWIPSMEDMPESCTSCKFEIDPPPPVIAEADWTDVECRVCHVEKKGEIQPEVLWLEIAPIEEYAEVGSHSELCLKCHLGQEVPGHVPVHVDGAHQGYECTECHQAHSLEANCGEAGCHPDVFEPGTEIPGHDEEHELIGCEACHDAGGMRIGPHPETGEWTTFVSVESEDEWKPIVSHRIGLEVTCERCHYQGNPWELVSELEPPAGTN